MSTKCDIQRNGAAEIADPIFDKVNDWRKSVISCESPTIIEEILDSDSEDEQNASKFETEKNLHFLELLERAKSINHQCIIEERKKIFPYKKLKNLCMDIKERLPKIYSKVTKDFIWRNLFNWLHAIQHSFEGSSDLKYDDKFNLLLTEILAEFVHYKSWKFARTDDCVEAQEVSNEIIAVFNGFYGNNYAYVLMTLLRVDFKGFEGDKRYAAVLCPIFKKYLTKKYMNQSTCFSYSRLILCFKKWKYLLPLEQREKVIILAVGDFYLDKYPAGVLAPDIIETEEKELSLIFPYYKRAKELQQKYGRNAGMRSLLRENSSNLNKMISTYFEVFTKSIHDAMWDNECQQTYQLQSPQKGKRKTKRRNNNVQSKENSHEKLIAVIEILSEDEDKSLSEGREQRGYPSFDNVSSPGSSENATPYPFTGTITTTLQRVYIVTTSASSNNAFYTQNSESLIKSTSNSEQQRILSHVLHNDKPMSLPSAFHSGDINLVSSKQLIVSHVLNNNSNTMMPSAFSSKQNETDMHDISFNKSSSRNHSEHSDSTNSGNTSCKKAERNECAKESTFPLEADCDFKEDRNKTEQEKRFEVLIMKRLNNSDQIEKAENKLDIENCSNQLQQRNIENKTDGQLEGCSNKQTVLRENHTTQVSFQIKSGTNMEHSSITSKELLMQQNMDDKKDGSFDISPKNVENKVGRQLESPNNERVIRENVNNAEVFSKNENENLLGQENVEKKIDGLLEGCSNKEAVLKEKFYKTKAISQAESSSNMEHSSNTPVELLIQQNMNGKEGGSLEISSKIELGTILPENLLGQENVENKLDGQLKSRFNKQAEKQEKMLGQQNLDNNKAGHLENCPNNESVIKENLSNTGVLSENDLVTVVPENLLGQHNLDNKNEKQLEICAIEISVPKKTICIIDKEGDPILQQPATGADEGGENLTENKQYTQKRKEIPFGRQERGNTTKLFNKVASEEIISKNQKPDDLNALHSDKSIVNKLESKKQSKIGKYSKIHNCTKVTSNDDSGHEITHPLKDSLDGDQNLLSIERNTDGFTIHRLENPKLSVKVSINKEQINLEKVEQNNQQTGEIYEESKSSGMIAEQSTYMQQIGLNQVNRNVEILIDGEKSTNAEPLQKINPISKSAKSNKIESQKNNTEYLPVSFKPEENKKIPGLVEINKERAIYVPLKSSITSLNNSPASSHSMENNEIEPTNQKENNDPLTSNNFNPQLPFGVDIASTVTFSNESITTDKSETYHTPVYGLENKNLTKPVRTYGNKNGMRRRSNNEIGIDIVPVPKKMSLSNILELDNKNLTKPVRTYGNKNGMRRRSNNEIGIDIVPVPKKMSLSNISELDIQKKTLQEDFQNSWGSKSLLQSSANLKSSTISTQVTEENSSSTNTLQERPEPGDIKEEKIEEGDIGKKEKFQISMQNEEDMPVNISKKQQEEPQPYTQLNQHGEISEDLHTFQNDSGSFDIQNNAEDIDDDPSPAFSPIGTPQHKIDLQTQDSKVSIEKNLEENLNSKATEATTNEIVDSETLNNFGEETKPQIFELLNTIFYEDKKAEDTDSDTNIDTLFVNEVAKFQANQSEENDLFRTDPKLKNCYVLVERLKKPVAQNSQDNANLLTRLEPLKSEVHEGQPIVQNRQDILNETDRLIVRQLVDQWDVNSFIEYSIESNNENKNHSENNSNFSNAKDKKEKDCLISHNALSNDTNDLEPILNITPNDSNLYFSCAFDTISFDINQGGITVEGVLYENSFPVDIDEEPKKTVRDFTEEPVEDKDKIIDDKDNQTDLPIQHFSNNDTKVEKVSFIKPLEVQKSKTYVREKPRNISGNKPKLSSAPASPFWSPKKRYQEKPPIHVDDSGKKSTPPSSLQGNKILSSTNIEENFPFANNELYELNQQQSQGHSIIKRPSEWKPEEQPNKRLKKNNDLFDEVKNGTSPSQKLSNNILNGTDICSTFVCL